MGLFNLLEFSQFYSMNRLSKALIDLKFFQSVEENQRTDHLFNQLNGKLIERVLPEFKDNYHNYNKLLQVLLLSRNFQNQIELSRDFVANYDNNWEQSHHKCIKWSFRQLNLLIASMAMISKSDKQFFDLKTNESFKPKFVDIFYKLKTLKVLSFLAVEPRLPIELLSVIINESFLWTEPTQLSENVMQLHSRLISHFSNYVKDNKSFQTHMREDFFFELKECLRYICTHFHSFIDYLVNALNKTQIDLIVDNFGPKLKPLLEQTFGENHYCVHFFTETAANPTLLSNEDFLLEVVSKVE